MKSSALNEQNHSAKVVASGGDEGCGDVLRQGGGAADLCIGDHLSVLLLRHVASLLLRERGGSPEVLPCIPLTSHRKWHLFHNATQHHSQIFLAKK